MKESWKHRKRAILTHDNECLLNYLNASLEERKKDPQFFAKRERGEEDRPLLPTLCMLHTGLYGVSFFIRKHKMNVVLAFTQLSSRKLSKPFCVHKCPEI